MTGKFLQDKMVILWRGSSYEHLEEIEDGGDGMDSARAKKSGLSRLFRTLGSKKDKFKTSPRHMARLKSGSKAAEAPARTNDGACLPTLQPGDVLLGDEHCVQLMLAVRDGHLTMEQAVQRLRQRDTLRLRNHKNRDEMLNEFARSLLWSQSANKKAQANSIFYTDGLNIPACAGLHEQHAPIYYEPPDASLDVGGVGGVAPHSRRICGACVAAPTPSSAVDHRFCTTLPRNAANSTAVTSSPFKAPPSAPLPLLSSSSTTTYSKSATPEVCDGNCGNIMCSVRAAADSSPSPPAEGTTVLDEVESESACCESAPAEDAAAPSRTVPDVAHESELKRAAAAAGSEGGRDGASGAATPTPHQPARGGKSAGMLGRLRSITQSRSSYTSEEGHSQSSDYEDQEDIEKMAESQRSEDQQRNSFVGRVKHLHKDVKKKISKFRNSRNSVDGSITDEKDVVEEGLQPGSSVESIPSGSAGSRSSLQAHTPSSSNRSSSSIGEEECTQCVGPIVGRARALVDNTPSPYDKDGLPFKKGDIIDILSKNTTGTWVGMVNKKVGHFKFITVEEIPDESKPRQRKFPSVPKLDHRPETLEELLQTFGLQNYLNVLMLHGYQDLDVFKEVMKEDLDSLGITNHEHQLLIFQLAEMLLDYDGENLGEYTEVAVSPVPDPQVPTDASETQFNNLDGGAEEAPAPTDPTVPCEGVDSVINGGETLCYEPNIPVVELESDESRHTVVEDEHEGQNGVGDAGTADISEANEETSGNGICKEVPRPIPRTFLQDFRSALKEDEVCNDTRLSESPARIPYGSSFARKVRSSTLPRKDSDEMDDERMTGRKGSLQDAKSTQRLPSMPLRACIEHKLAAEGIDLCREPYTDMSGFCGIPPALVQRYSEELQRDVGDVARALDQVRICELGERGRHGEKSQLQFDERWPKMRPTILKLLHQEPITRNEWQGLFWDVHAVCLWDEKGPSKLYAALQEDILEFIRIAQRRVLEHEEDQALLNAYIREWRKFFVQCSYLPMPFGQLEAVLAGKSPKRAEEGLVRKLMLDTWNQSIFCTIKGRLQASAMKLVHAERNGEAFDSQLVVGVRESYVNLCSNPEDRLQIYRENFERAYIDATRQFYRTQAPQYLEENGVQNYMRYADQKLKEEEQRASKYLESYSGSIQALTECCVSVLVTAFKEVILAECPGMIRANETEKLQLMFSLLDRVPEGVGPMLRDLEQHILAQGLADMHASADVITQDSEKYVEQLLDLFQQFSRLVKDAFNDDPRFLTARDKAFKQVVNDTSVFRLELPCKQKGVANKTQPESRCPELLANYCDMLLRKTPLSKKLTSDQIEAKLKEVLLVLRYVQNKDVFMRYHKAHLTRRLILDSSADSEKEENMVEWLRDVGMPADYVNKLARMFQDIKVSEDLNQQFKDVHRNSKGLLADSINIKILNAGAWARGSERVQVSLPLELEDFIPEVEEFYRRKHSGRKLQWYHHMSNGTITFCNQVGKFDLDVTTFQMAVMFAWNQRPHDKISFENLRLATELPDAELRRTLWSLVAFPKLKRQVLLCGFEAKSPKDFDDSTLFWVNQEFSVIKNGKVQKRGKVNLIGRLQLSTEKSKEEDNENIVQLRILRTQEAIVKIMKMRKRITNAQLQTELVEILKNMFLPSKKMIKEQIEWLIEHKYMRRDEDNINEFIYMA